MDLMWWWMWPIVVVAIAVTVLIALVLRRHESICLLYTSPSPRDRG